MNWSQFFLRGVDILEDTVDASQSVLKQPTRQSNVDPSLDTLGVAFGWPGAWLVCGARWGFTANLEQRAKDSAYCW